VGGCESSLIPLFLCGEFLGTGDMQANPSPKSRITNVSPDFPPPRLNCP